MKRAENHFFGLEKRIAEIPTDIIEGMRAKIRCAKLWARPYRLDSIPGGCEEAMGLSMFRDIERLAARNAS